MDKKTVLSRRRMLLLGSVAAVSGLAGCTGDGDSEDDDNGDDGDDNGDDSDDNDDDSDDNDDDSDDNDDDSDDNDDDSDDNGGYDGNSEHALTTYTNDEYGYELQVPDGWTTDETNPAEVTFYGDGVEELILSTFRYPPGLTLDELADEAISNSRVMPAFEVVDQTDATTESGDDGRIIEWRYSPPLTDVRYHAKFLVVITDSGVVYSVEMATDETEYDEAFDALVEAVLASFTIVDPPEPSEIDLDAFDTYENDQLGYNLDHPAAWTAIDLPDGTVVITDDFGIRGITVLGGPSEGESLEELADGFRTEMEFDPTMTFHDEDAITLTSGHDAIVFDFELQEDGTHRGSYVLAVDEESATSYVLVVETEESLYDDAFEEALERVVESFSIEGARTQSNSQFQLQMDAPALSTVRPQRFTERSRGWTDTDDPRGRARFGASIV